MIAGLIRPTRDGPLTSAFERSRERGARMISLVENRTAQAELLADSAELRRQVEVIVQTTPVIDVHTHVFPIEFKGLYSEGIDDLLTYHYLIAETFRSAHISHKQFW